MNPVPSSNKANVKVDRSEEILSEHNFKDEYEEDFIEESSRLKKSKNALDKEESSGGFDEKYDEDFF